MTGEVAEITVRAGKQHSEVVRIDHGPNPCRERLLRVRLESSSVLDLQELHQGSGSGDTILVKVDMELAPGARMRHVAIVDGGDDRFDFDRRVRLAGEAELEYTRIGAGADEECLRIDLDGSCSRFRHGALMLVGPGRKAALELHMNHRAHHAVSDSLCRCVVSAGGRGRFAGRILIDPDGQGADARLRNDNLLLDESARMETRPELEVYADEVQCAHGAATGALDEAALFYLGTRGLSPPQARAMLVRAFVSRIGDAIALDEAKTMAAAILSRALGDAGPCQLTARSQ